MVAAPIEVAPKDEDVAGEVAAAKAAPLAAAQERARSDGFDNDAPGTAAKAACGAS